MRKDREEYNEYQRKYQLERYYRRRKEAIEFLGGKCNECGGAEELEFDHIDPATKELPVSQMWGVSEERFWNEVRKCQLLCKKHHIEKTHTNGDNGKFFAQHGSLAMYRHHKCRCDPCREVWNSASRKWTKKYKQKLKDQDAGIV
jgi:hypothetical protein